MKRLQRVFSGILAASILATSLSISSFAADSNSSFVFPEGFEDEPVVSMSEVGSDNALVEGEDADVVPIYSDDTIILDVQAGGIADNAFALSSDGEFTDYEESFDNTLDGVANTYYVPNVPSDYNVNRVLMANVYQAPAYDIQVDQISVYIGTNEYIRRYESYSSYIDFYLVTGFDGDLAKNYGSARRSYIGDAYVSSYWDEWITVNTDRRALVSANTEYAIVAEFSGENREIDKFVSATQGSYGTGTSYVGYKGSNSYSGDGGKSISVEDSYSSVPSYGLTDIANDGMRAALNVHVSKYDAKTSVADPYVYIDSSCEYTSPYVRSVNGNYLWEDISVLKSSPVLKWRSVKNATAYNIYRGALKNDRFDVAKIASVGGTTTTYTDKSVSSGAYGYIVTAVVGGKETYLDYCDPVYCIFPSLTAPVITNKGLQGSYNKIQFNKTYGLNFSTYEITVVDSNGKKLGTSSSYDDIENDVLPVYVSSMYEFYDYDLDDYVTGYGKSVSAILWGIDGSGNWFCTYPSNVVNLIRKTEAAPQAVSFTADSTSYRTQISITGSDSYSRYTILRKESTQSYYSPIKTFNTSSSGNSMVYNDTEIIPGKKYFYAVVAANNYYDEYDLQNYILGTKVKAITVPTSNPPAKPSFTYVKATLSEDKTSTDYELIWTPVSGATSYKIYSAPLYSNNTKGYFTYAETVKNFFKTYKYYTNSDIVGYFFYVVPSNTTANVNGAPASTYFKSEMSAGEEVTAEKFWISATPSDKSVALKYTSKYNYDVRLFRYTGNDSMMKYVGYNAVPSGGYYASEGYTDSNVENGETYTYRALLTEADSYPYIISIDDTISATVASKAKPVISHIEPIAFGVDISWGKVAGATKYGVYSYYGGKYTALGVTTDTNFTATGLTGGVKYGFLVRAYVNNAWTAFTTSDLVYATPAKYIASPNIVKGIALDKAVELKWEIIPGATRYALYTYDKTTEKYSLISNAYTSTSATVTGLTNYKQYGFLVRAYGSGVWSDIDESKIAYCTPRSDTPAPEIGIADDGSVIAYWDSVYYAEKYMIYTYLDGKYTAYGPVLYTEYKFTDLKPGVKYGFLVRSCTNGTWSAFSSADLVYFTVPSDATAKPFSVNVEPGDKCAYITWSLPVGATKSAVYSYDPVTKKYALLDNNIYGTEYVAKGLTNDTKIGFMVRAYVNGTWSSYSTDDDVVYTTPQKASFSTRLSDSYYNYLYIYMKSYYNAAIAPTKYAVYLYRDGKYKLYTTVDVDANNSYTYLYITDVVPGEELGVLVRGYMCGAWTDYTDEDVKYFNVPYAELYASTEDNAGNRVLLEWNECKNATKYAVFTYDTSTAKYTLKGTTEGTSLSFTVDQPAFTQDSYNINVLVRPYVNGAYVPFENGSYRSVYVSSLSFYPDDTGIDNGIAIYGYESDDIAEYRFYLLNESTGKYDLKAETHGEPV
ncbi:MAG: hypothetical protein ACI4WS_13895, partial [Oscillospiraceae bacterium]